MPLVSDNSKHPSIQRNVVFCGETGTGKSSTINLLLQSGALASVSSGSQLCTQVSAKYETTLNGMRCNLWDTRGLGEGRSFLQALFGRSSDKELKKFLKERHQRHELDLLVYCVRGSRASAASVKYYKSFCAITRRLAAPVVIVITHLEKEKDMEGWWNKNSSRFEEFQMEFDGHVCITTIVGDSQADESRKRLVDSITRNHRWAPQDSGSYFGSRVQKSTPSAPPRGRGISRLFKPKDSGNPPTNHSGPSTTSSPRNSSYHTAESPQESVPPTPIVEPSTPCSAATPAKIDTDLLIANDPLQSSSEETSSARSSLHSIFHTSPHSSYTSEVHLQPCTEENEGHLGELPFKHPTTTVRRKQSYPTQHGAFGDIWECELISGEPPRLVAVKAVKVDTKDDEDRRSREKKLRREMRVWERLRHRNIVPLLGVVSGFGPLPSMVSPWFSNGSLSRYLARHQTLSLSEKHRLLKDIATGLSYLHHQGVIHGDLHSDNVLVDDDGTACLTDFGLSLVMDFVGTSYLKSNICGGVQFADPALVQRIDRSQDIVCYPTKPCDVYSFGGLMLHVLSGKKPYEEIHSIPAIFATVLKGVQPQIPTHDKHITHGHRLLIQKCWDHEEHRRPSADDLVRKFVPQ